MKTRILLFSALVMAYFSSAAQDKSLQLAVGKLDQAQSVKDYEQLEKEFNTMAVSQKTAWLPYYYAAFCNAKIGFLYQDDGDRIEPYSKAGEGQALKALLLLDTVHQKQELAEVYTVISMVYRTRVFINPMTYGRKYGTLSQQYLDNARALAPKNPRILYVQAWVKYNTPKLWGGDKTLAKQLAEQSLAALGSGTSDVNPHWGKKEDQELLSRYK